MVMVAYDQSYLPYLDLFEKCLSRSYPDYSIAFLACQYISPACYRYVYEPTFGGNVYITDIDMMILREDPPLDTMHIAEMAAEGIPFSNSPRDTEPEGKERLTGLHFASWQWYEKTRQARLKYTLKVFDGEIGTGPYDDEKMLMNIAKESGLPIPAKKPLIPRHHGIHLGTLRDFWHDKKRLKEELRIRVTPDMARQWVELQPMYTGNMEIDDHLEFLLSFCKRRVKQ